MGIDEFTKALRAYRATMPDVGEVNDSIIQVDDNQRALDIMFADSKAYFLVIERID